jgi:predicted transcriptional regulator
MIFRYSVFCGMLSPPTGDTRATTNTGDNKAETRMTTETKTPLSDELQTQIEQIAREENREPSEVLEEAVRRYVGVQALERLARNGEKYARARGIKEEDVPGLVHEVRLENRDRGR